MECVISYRECEAQRHLSRYIGTGSLYGRVLIAYIQYMSYLTAPLAWLFFATILPRVAYCLTSAYTYRFSPINKTMIDGKVISVEFIELRNLFKDIDTRYYVFPSEVKIVKISFYSRCIIFATSTKYHHLFPVTSNVYET